MANTKNKIVSVPLNSGLNFSKIKTGITQYTGFNDLNSPIYGDTISPLYYRKAEPGKGDTGLPTIDENGILNDRDGNAIMDLSKKHRVVREVLDVPKNALAVRGPDFYVHLKGDQTRVVYGKGKEKLLPYKATCAAYSEKNDNVDVLFITRNGTVAAYDVDSMALLKEAPSIRSDLVRINTFYDPYCNWQVLSIYEPFGDYKVEIDMKHGPTGYQPIIGSYKAPYNYIFDQINNTFTKKTLTLGWIGTTGDGDVCYSPESFIFTGIHSADVRKHYNNDWDSESDYNYVYYRVASVPYKYYHTPRGHAEDGEVYVLSVVKTPGILWTKRDPNFPMVVPSQRGQYTASECIMKLDAGSRVYLNNDCYATLTGTMKNGIPSTWLEFRGGRWTGYGAGSPTFDDSWYKGFDFGIENFTYLRSADLGSTYSDRQILDTGAYFNFCSVPNTLYYNKPTYEKEQLVPKPIAKDIFRVIYTNGAISNVSAAADADTIGTMMETQNTIDDKTPVYWPSGREGHEVIYRNTYSEWVRCSITEEIPDINIINNRYVIIYTNDPANMVDLEDENSLHHFASDWNNRFSPYPMRGQGFEYNNKYTSRLSFGNGSWEEHCNLTFGSGSNLHPEISKNPIVGYNPAEVVLYEASSLYPFAYMSSVDDIDFYAARRDRGQTVPTYMYTLDNNRIGDPIPTHNNSELASLTYPRGVYNIPNLFGDITFTSYNTAYLKYKGTIYTFLQPDELIIFAYTLNATLDLVEELFVIQGQPFCITMNKYIYSVYYSNNGTVSKGEPIIDVKGLLYCGSIPEMAIFYSPMDRTLKSFTADRVMQNLQQATAISVVNKTKYCPQTFAIYIATDNGTYVYSRYGQYRLDIDNVTDISFGGENDRHTYITYMNGKKREAIDVIHSLDGITDAATYSIKPVKLATKYYGIGNNNVSVTDCVYFRLFSESGPINTYVNITERTITDGVYTSKTKKLKVNTSEWDKETNTCYVRYQPQQQRSAGISIELETECAISAIDFSVSAPDTVALSRPTMNM